MYYIVCSIVTCVPIVILAWLGSLSWRRGGTYRAYGTDYESVFARLSPIYY